MAVRSIDQNGGHGRGDKQEAGPDAEREPSRENSGSLMRFARMAMRRKPVLILLILTICLVLTVLYSWQLVRNGDVSGLVLVGANLCAFVIALVYLADDLLRR
jgi:hypothetical protein